jgi:hypothetical protein
LLDTHERALSSIQVLSQLPLCWYWASRHFCPDDDCPLTINKRQITLLNSETVEMLLTDLDETDADGYGREVILLGADASHPPSWDAEIEVKKFLALERSSIRIVILRLEDDMCDYMYFQPDDCSLFLVKMGEVGTNLLNCKQNYPYSRLRTAALDVRLNALMELLSAD